jgi:hypothetical protein
MVTVIFGVIVLVLVLLALNAFAKANPKVLAPILKTVGGVGALGVAGILAARGQVFLAIPIGAAGLGLLGWLPFDLLDRTQKSQGQVSRVRSAFLEMELDHDSGAMGGRILAGKHEGVMLDALDVKTLTSFLPEIDEESRALLMAYLDRRQPSWRDDVEGDPAAGESRPASWSSGKMTEEEAYQILGVKPGASAEDIGRAHRALMKKLHPDQGGSTYLAARVNEAKDVLLRRHR